MRFGYGPEIRPDVRPFKYSATLDYSTLPKLRKFEAVGYSVQLSTQPKLLRGGLFDTAKASREVSRRQGHTSGPPAWPAKIRVHSGAKSPRPPFAALLVSTPVPCHPQVLLNSFVPLGSDKLSRVCIEFCRSGR